MGRDEIADGPLRLITRLFRTACVTAVIVLAATACRSSVAPPPPPERLEVYAEVTALLPGQVDTIVAAIDSVRAVGPHIQWTSRAPEVLTVDTSGAISARAPGRATIVAVGPKNTDSIVVDVVAPPPGRIAFVGIRSISSTTEFSLWDMKPLGAEPRPMPNWLTNTGRPAFSPDGTMLAIPVGTPPTLYILSSDGQTILATPSAGLGCGSGAPTWSPDSRRLAFSSCASGRFNAWVYTLADSSVRRVSDFRPPYGLYVHRATFAPDDNALITELFVHDEGAVNPEKGQFDLFRIDLGPGGDVQRLTNTPLDELGPAASFATGRLLFSRRLSTAPASEPYAEVIYTAQTHLGEQVLVTDSARSALTGKLPESKVAAFSPDGQWIVFERNIGSLPGVGTRIGVAGTVSKQLFAQRLADGLRIRLTRFWAAAQPSWTSE